MSGKKYLLHGAYIVTGEGVRKGSVYIEGERIGEIWYPDENGKMLFNGSEQEFASLPQHFQDAEIHYLDGKHVFAGGIDAHVHFREPGLVSKADMETESMAAAMGGVTSFIDMPNTNPPTISEKRIDEKCGMAEGRVYANYGFHIGLTNENYGEIEQMCSQSPEKFAGIKVFMGSSTGNMLVDKDETLERVFSLSGKEVLVHCEDENTVRENLKAAQDRYGDEIPFSEHGNIRSRKACIRSSAKALELAIKHGTRLHLLHISTEEEIEMARAARLSGCGITAETSINYLWFCDTDYAALGSRIKCNPSIKTGKDRKALVEALKNGLIDTIGSDHAPHLLEEKQKRYMAAPSGIPSLQHSLPVLLTLAERENIPLERIASVFSEKAADMFGIKDRGSLNKGCFADIVIADCGVAFTVNKKDLLYKCGWSPYEGATLKGRVETVFVNGVKVADNGMVLPAAPPGKKLIFEK